MLGSSLDQRTGLGLGTKVSLRQFILLSEVIIIITDVIYDLLISQVKDPCSSAVNEITVMAYVKDCSLISIQRILQDFLGSNIQMVRRLVKEQEISLAKHQLCKGHTTALATGQIADKLINIITCKEESSQCITDLCII